jgi:hypothetical protein
MTAEIDRARLIEIATAIRRGARQPVVIELCDGVFALATAKHVDATPLPDVDATPCPAHRLFLEQKALKGHFVGLRQKRDSTAGSALVLARSVDYL